VSLDFVHIGPSHMHHCRAFPFALTGLFLYPTYVRDCVSVGVIKTWCLSTVDCAPDAIQLMPLRVNMI